MDIRAFTARHGNTIAILLILALIVLIWFIAPRSARADGYADGYRDPYAGASRLRSEPVYYHRETIRDHLSASEKDELRRIHDRALRRMQADRDVFARTIRKSPRNRQGNHRYPYADQHFYDEKTRQGTRYARRAVTSDAYKTPDDRECRAALSVTSEERGWRGRALKDAQDKWSAKAIATHGYRWGNIDKARAISPDCNPIRRNKFGVNIWVCDFSARPCRGL